MPPPARSAATLAMVLLLAAPAGGEVYRWRDASGREHFAQQLHQVPPEHRAAARAAAEAAPASERVSYHETAQRRPSAGARAVERDAAEPAPPAALAPGGLTPGSFACKQIQKQVARKEKVIRTHRGSVEANQRWADDIDRSPFSRRRYELRAEEEARWLARAEADLERFVDAQRRRGVPPGCLR